MQLKAIGEAYKAVDQFNTISGQHDNVTHETVNHAISMIFSEFEELVESFEEGDVVNVAKEAADLLITVFGLIQKLEITGITMQGVIRDVCENNASKYIKQDEPLQYDEKFTASFNQEFGVWVIRDKDNKVRKPANFVNADVSQYVLKNMFKEAAV